MLSSVFSGKLDTIVQTSLNTHRLISFNYSRRERRALAIMARRQLVQHSIFILVSVLVSFFNTNYGVFCKFLRHLFTSLIASKTPHKPNSSQQHSHDGGLARPSTDLKKDVSDIDSDDGHSSSAVGSDMYSTESDPDIGSLENGFVIEVAIHEPRVVHINEVPDHAKRRSKHRAISATDKSAQALTTQYLLIIVKALTLARLRSAISSCIAHYLCPRPPPYKHRFTFVPYVVVTSPHGESIAEEGLWYHRYIDAHQAQLLGLDGMDLVKAEKIIMSFAETHATKVFRRLSTITTSSYNSSLHSDAGSLVVSH